MRCPESGWLVPLLPTMIVSASKYVVVELVPIEKDKRYNIVVKYCRDKNHMESLSTGTIQDGNIVHSPDGINVYRVSINTIRGDFKEGNANKNKLRLWEKTDYLPRPSDIFQERLYCIPIRWIGNIYVIFNFEIL